MRIKIAVPEVVYGATCTTHDESADAKKTSVGRNDVWRGYGSGERSGEEGAEEAGKEQVICARWLVEANKFSVGNPTLRYVR